MQSVGWRLLGRNLPTSLSIPLEISSYSKATKDTVEKAEESWGKGGGTCDQATRSTAMEEKSSACLTTEDAGALWGRHSRWGVSTGTGVVYGRNDSDVTNFIRPYLHQISINSHGLNGYGKPLKRPFDWYQSCLEAINNGRDIRQINW